MTVLLNDQSYWRGKRVLVTGSAGFLGSHLVEVLVSSDARVVGLDCLANPGRLKDVIDRVEYLSIDIASRDWMEKIPKKFDFIFHLAAFAAPSAAQENPELAFRQNVNGTQNVLEFAMDSSVKKFVFMSAGALYTNVPKYLPIDEKHPISPMQGVYATTKRIGELICEDFGRNYGLPYVYFRLFNTYGPRQSPEYLIPSFILQARSGENLTVFNGEIRRDFSYVGDIVEALLRAASSEYRGGPVNLGTGIEHTIGEVAKKIADRMGVEVECLNRQVFGPARQLCDNRLAKTLFRWEPRCSLDEGLEITIRSFTETGS